MLVFNKIKTSIKIICLNTVSIYTYIIYSCLFLTGHIIFIPSRNSSGTGYLLSVAPVQVPVKSLIFMVRNGFMLSMALWLRGVTGTIL